MKKVPSFLILVLSVVTPCFADGADDSVPSPHLAMTVPYAATKVGESFQVRLSIDPPVQKTVRATFESNKNFSFEHRTVEIRPGSKPSVTVKVMGAGADGLPYLNVFSDGYGDAELPVNVGFLGHIKMSSTRPLPYEGWSTITLALVDKDGKSFSTEKPLEVLVQSTDAALRMGGEQSGLIKLPLLRNANVTQPFQVRPLKLQGGDIHLNATLTTEAIPGFSLDTQYLSLQADPAWWLPLVLAIGGGLMYGIYKALNTAEWPKERVAYAIGAALLTSALAGLFGYLIASLDLLGLKLDPNSLRSYPLLGFLVAYIGVDPFVSKIVPKKP